MPFSPGDRVHVASFGKATIREPRGGGRYLVELKGISMVVTESQLTPLAEPTRQPRTMPASGSAASPVTPPHAGAPSSIDLHGMTVAEALEALDAFLNNAMLAGLDEVRIVHGRSGGRLKAAVHRRLRLLPSVARYRLDPANPGQTLVAL